MGFRHYNTLQVRGHKCYEFAGECVACQASGEFILANLERIACPRCGATYICWLPTPGKAELKCVVRPVFRERNQA
jgi:hypothetical protein